MPLLAPLGTPAVLAALLGLNIGSGLTWTGSLANLLWRRTLVRTASGRAWSSSTGSSLVRAPRVTLLAAVTVAVTAVG